jgi:hypothetical protein
VGVDDDFFSDSQLADREEDDTNNVLNNTLNGAATALARNHMELTVLCVWSSARLAQLEAESGQRLRRRSRRRLPVAAVKVR